MINDACLICPRQTKRELTPEGFKFCVYCAFRKERLRNRQQYWKGEGYRCPCENNVFYVDRESHLQPQQSFFAPTRATRVTIICTRCGARRYPSEVLE